MNQGPGPEDRRYPQKSFDFSRLRSTFKFDLLAGITVSLVAIPQSLAYAQLAGVPAYFGLYAALIPTIIGAVFGLMGAFAAAFPLSRFAGKQ